MSSFYVLGNMLNTLAVLFYLILPVTQQVFFFFFFILILWMEKLRLREVR